MKNLNKVLALVLALVMALGMVASADFSDVAADSQYKEAVDVLASLKVLGGYPDGTFKPEKEVSRAEAAAMLYRAFSGKAYASIYEGMTKFSDVAADNWATGYINYGVTTEMIGGYPDGTFKPEKNVTLNEFVKMILGGLGHDVSDFAKCLVIAVENGLVDGLPENITAGTPLTRGMCAQIVYNALFTTYIKFPYQIVGEDGIISTAYPTLGGKIFGFGTFDGIIIDYNDEIGIDFRVDEDFGFKFVVVAGERELRIFRADQNLYDYIGQSIKVTYKKASGRDRDVAETVYGISLLNNKVASAWSDNLPAANDQGVRTIDGVEVDPDISAFYLDENNVYVEIDDYYEDLLPDYYLNLKVIDYDGDSKADLMYIKNFEIGTVDAFGDGKITIGGDEYVLADLYKTELSGNIAKGARVLYNPEDGRELYAKALNVETGAFTSIRGGNEFKLGGSFRTTMQIPGGNTSLLNVNNLGSSFNYIMLNGRVVDVAAIEQTVAPAAYNPLSYILVNKITQTQSSDIWGNQTGKLYADVIRADGSAGVIEIHNASYGKNLLGENYNTPHAFEGAARMMSFAMDGGLVKLSDAITAGADHERVLSSAGKMVKTGSQFVCSGAIYSASEQTVFFIETTKADGSKSTAVYTAATVPAQFEVVKAVVTKDEPIARMVAVYGEVTETAAPPVSKDAKPILVTGVEIIREGDKNVYAYNVIDVLTGAASVLKTGKTDLANGAYLYSVVEGSEVFEEFIADLKLTADAAAPFVFTESGVAELAADAKIIVVNSGLNGVAAGSAADLKNESMIAVYDYVADSNGNGLDEFKIVIVFAK